MGSNNIVLAACGPTVSRILHNCRNLSPESVKNILIVYDERAGYLGDFCTRFDKVRYVKQFFTNASLRLNYAFAKDGNFIHSLFCHDPYLDSITHSLWDEIDFNAYEVVLLASHHQLKMLAYLQARYRDLITSGQFRTAVYSISEVVLTHLPAQDFKFPICERLQDFIWRIPNKTGEICVTEDEQEWAGRWLEAQGLQPHERLVIFLDSTTHEEKLVDTRVYFDILGNVLARKDVKVLVFDELGIGKEQFYREKLGAKKMKRMIFSSGQTLRQDLSIIASRYTRVIFGPCTGLLHCASGIYNYYVNNGIRSRFEVPSLIVYTGQYPGSKATANTWWRMSPLVDTLLLKEIKKKKSLVLLSSLEGDEKNTKDVLPCKEYPAQLIIDFIDKKLRPLKEKIYG
jgi:hypothetical protein